MKSSTLLQLVPCGMIRVLDLPLISSVENINRFVKPIRVLIKFSRLHTLVATTLATIMIFLLVNSGVSDVSWANTKYLLWYLIMAISLNIFVVGINQIYDLPVDKINKPNLPLPKGDLTTRESWQIVIIMVILSFGVAFTSLILLLTSLSIVAIGIFYSVPPFRMRNQFILASLLITLGRGLILHLSAYFYFNQKVNGSFSTTPSLWFIIIFASIFVLTISFFKDIHDTEGDAMFHITTLPVWTSRSVSFVLSIAILISAYLWAFWFYFNNTEFPIWLIANVYHSLVIFLLGVSLFFQRGLLANKVHIQRFYQLIWILLYIEYLLLGSLI